MSNLQFALNKSEAFNYVHTPDDEDKYSIGSTWCETTIERKSRKRILSILRHTTFFRPQHLHESNLWGGYHNIPQSFPISCITTQDEATYFDEKDAFNILLFEIRKMAFFRNQTKLFERILELIEDSKEENPEILPIAIDSLHGFKKFLKQSIDFKKPFISLTPDNSIYISWREANNQLFSILFQKDENVQFVIFTPNEKHPSKVLRLYGSATVDTIIEKLQPLGIMEWITK